MSLANKLEKLRNQNGYTRAGVARVLGLKYTTYVGYENGEREPGHGFLIAAAKFYGVTVDFLLDIDNLPESYYYSADDPFNFIHEADDAQEYGQLVDDTEDLLNKLKDDPSTRLVAKISGDLTDEGKKDLLKYAELLKNQRDSGGDD